MGILNTNFYLRLRYTLLRHWLRMTGREYHIRGKCIGCGKCCQLINLKTEKGWIRNKQEFQNLIKKNPEYSRFTPVGVDNSGFLQFHCSVYSQRAGCQDYANRLDICRNYPTRYLPLYGGKLLKGCGYRVECTKPFRKILAAEIKKRKGK